MGPSAGVVVVVVIVVIVRNNVRQSCDSRTVSPRIIKFYRNLYTRPVYKRTGYEVTMYLRSEVIGVRKRAENDACDGFNIESP